MQGEISVREERIKRLEKKAEEYRTEEHLTEDFFCKYDPHQDYVLTIEKDKQKTGFIKPRCVPVENETVRKETIDRHDQLIGRLLQVHERVRKYQAMLVDYTNMTAEDFNNFNSFLHEVDQAIGIKLENMQNFVTDLEAELTQCTDNIFSSHHNSLMHLEPNVCEPLEPIVDSIEHDFFPRIFYMEEVFGKAKVKQAEKAFKATTSILWNAIVFLVKKIGLLLNAIGQAFWYFLTYSKDVLFHVGAATFKKFTNFICYLSRDPKNLLKFYNAMYQIFRNANLSAGENYIPIANDKMKEFCTGDNQKLIPLIFETLNNVSTEFNPQSSELSTDVKSKIDEEDFEKFAKILLDIRKQGFNEQLCKAKRIFAFGEPHNTSTKVIAFLWAICVNSCETIRKVINQTNFCSARFAEMEKEKEMNQDIARLAKEIKDAQNNNQTEKVQRLEGELEKLQANEETKKNHELEQKKKDLEKKLNAQKAKEADVRQKATQAIEAANREIKIRNEKRRLRNQFRQKLAFSRQLGEEIKKIEKFYKGPTSGSLNVEKKKILEELLKQTKVKLEENEKSIKSMRETVEENGPFDDEKNVEEEEEEEEEKVPEHPYEFANNIPNLVNTSKTKKDSTEMLSHFQVEINNFNKSVAEKSTEKELDAASYLTVIPENVTATSNQGEKIFANTDLTAIKKKLVPPANPDGSQSPAEERKANAELNSLFTIMFNFFFFSRKFKLSTAKDVESGVAKKYSLDNKYQDTNLTEREIISAILSEPFEERMDLKHQIEDHILYAYCRAQDNSPNACLTLIDTGKPIHAKPDAEARYALYLQEAKAMKKGEEYEEQALMLGSEEEVNAMVNEILESVPGTKVHEDEMMQRLKMYQQFAPKQKDFDQMLQKSSTVTNPTTGSKLTVADAQQKQPKTLEVAKPTFVDLPVSQKPTVAKPGMSKTTVTNPTTGSKLTVADAQQKQPKTLEVAKPTFAKPGMSKTIAQNVTTSTQTAIKSAGTQARDVKIGAPAPVQTGVRIVKLGFRK